MNLVIRLGCATALVGLGLLELALLDALLRTSPPWLIGVAVAIIGVSMALVAVATAYDIMRSD